MRGRLRTAVRTILLAASATVLALACAAPAQALGPPDSHSPNADAINSAFWVLLVVVVAVVVVINAALIVALVRFRERRGREPSRFAAGRGALRPVVGALSLLAVVIFVYGVVVTNDVRGIEQSGPNGLGAAQTAQVGVKGLPASAAIEGTESATGEEPISGEEPSQTSPLLIDAIAQQWLWRFEYPGGQPGQRTFTYGELVVPVDTTVILDITSTDVLHTWWVPALGGQVQAAPGDVTRTWFKADEEGRYPGRSTVFSGTGYPVMRAWVRVVSVPDYQAHIERLKADLAEAQGIVQQTQEEQSTPESAIREEGE
ncbi:MAG TPA: cytochrome c oxidase subunit II [Solirubrobacterales bacterium]|nr:cytochrome c oxidase subunit II [Solirubrobacterales bacterium]